VLGELHGDEAVRYAREHDQPEFLTCVLLWMGAALFYGDRCAGPLEHGFVDRIRKDYPHAIDHLFMRVYQQHPEALN
jgi:hypothetical protein